MPCLDLAGRVPWTGTPFALDAVEIPVGGMADLDDLSGDVDEERERALARYSFEPPPVRRSSEEDEIGAPWSPRRVPTFEDFERRYG